MLNTENEQVALLKDASVSSVLISTVYALGSVNFSKQFG